MSLKKYKLCMTLCILIIILLSTLSMTYAEISREPISAENSKVNLNADELSVLEQINKIRKENGLKELRTYYKLQEVAEIKAKDIIENEYFSHTSPTYGTPFEMMDEHNVYYRVAGENLAGNTSPENAVNAWMNSKLHRDNILDTDFEYTAICVVDSEIYGKVFVQMFLGL